MTSRAWTRLVDVWRVQRPRACLLPVAVRPWQKALCATAGLAAFSSAATATVFASRKCVEATIFLLNTACDVHDVERRERERLERAAQREAARSGCDEPGSTRSWLDPLAGRLHCAMQTTQAAMQTTQAEAARRAVVAGVKTAAEVAFLTITPPLLVSTQQAMLEDARDTFRVVRGTTACCDIVRHTALYCVRTPFQAAFMAFVSTVAFTCVTDMCRRFGGVGKRRYY